MRIPTQCSACGTFELVSPSELQSGELSCAACGARASALPGESYTESDRPLFVGFAETLRTANIDAPQAAQVLRELGERREATTGNRIEKVVEILPSLGNLEVIVLEQRFPLRKAEGVLMLLLGAIARRRSRSGTFQGFSGEPLDSGEKTG